LVQNRAVDSSTTPLDSCMVSPPNFDHEKLDMLTKLVERFDPYQYRVRENAPSMAGSFEHEDDDEHEDD
jgi:hypothetical protein